MLNIVSNVPGKIVTLDKSGGWVISGHPDYRDLVLEIDTLCVRRAGGFFTNKRPVKAGLDFVFSSELYYLSGVIIGVEIE